METKTKTEQIMSRLAEEARNEKFFEINEEKKREILKIHRILVKYYIKQHVDDLEIRARMYRVYESLITRRNIETYYNTEIKVFVQKFFNAEYEF